MGNWERVANAAFKVMIPLVASLESPTMVSTSHENGTKDDEGGGCEAGKDEHRVLAEGAGWVTGSQ